jgi:N-acetylneuraminic acid mutarotase
MNSPTILGVCLLLAACDGGPSRDLTAPEPEAGTVDRQSGSLPAASNTWRRTSPMVGARAWMPAATIKGTIYVVGGVRGMSGAVEATATLQAYDVATNTWSVRKSLPFVNSGMNGASVINGRLYVTGGYGRRTLLVYNPERNTWTRKADMPDDGFYGAQGVIGGLLYVYAGATFGFHKFWRYNPGTDSWARLPTPLHLHEFPAAGVIAGKFYLAGGDDWGPTAALDVYNPATNTWTTKASMPEPRSRSASAVIAGKLYVAGGPNATARVYDPGTDSWAVAAPMPAARSNAAGVATGSGRFFVIGGVAPDGTILRRVEAYTP